MSTGAKYENQNRSDQETTITSKSQGKCDPVMTSHRAVSTDGTGPRPESTKNDKVG